MGETKIMAEEEEAKTKTTMAEEAKAKGNKAFSSHQYPQAIHFYTQAINLSLQNHLLYSNRSIAYSSLHDYSNALQDAQKTIQLNPTFSKGYARLGTALMGLERFQEAVSAFKNCVKLEPTNTSFKTALANAKSMLRKQHLSATLAKNLPEYIVEDILSRLPVKSLLRFRSVAKPWLCLISDSHFVRTHLERCTTQNLMFKEFYSETIENVYAVEKYFTKHVFRNFNICGRGGLEEIDSGLNDFLEKDDRYALIVKRSVNFIGSCDGLLCIISGSGDYGRREIVCLLNPFTREFKRLPMAPIVSAQYGSCNASYGFGYDPTIDDYKVVALVPFDGVPFEGFLKLHVYVYILGVSNAWRRISSVPSTMVTSRFGVLVSGHLHWISKLTTESRLLVAFDLVDESFKQVSMPFCPTDIQWIKVDVLGKCLHVMQKKLSNNEIELWAMKDYGVEESWTQIFTISERAKIGSSPYYYPLWLSEAGEVLLQRTDVSAHNMTQSTYLVMYDAEHEKTRALQVHGISKEFEAHSYFGSLVSLKSNEYVRHKGKETEDEEWKAEVHPLTFMWKV